MTVSAAESGPARTSSAPLFVVAGAHASLHWALATFYVLQPFIKDAYGLSYLEVGLFASIVHISAFATNVPAGMVIDLTGRRLACQMVSLFFSAMAIAGTGFAGGYWAIAFFAAVISSTNTLWHPAAISYLSSRYVDRRGLALSFHTVGASIGEAAAPLAVGACIAAFGWQAGAFAGAAAPAAAFLIIAVYFVLGANGDSHLNGRGTGGISGYMQGLRALFRDMRIWLLCLVTGFRGTTQAGLMLFLPLYLADDIGTGAVMLGVFMFLFQGAGGLATPFAGAASDRTGRRNMILIGTAAATVAVLLLAVSSELWMVAIAVPLAGATTFALRPVLQGWGMEMAPPALGGSMVSLLFGTQSAFSIAVPVAGGLIADAFGITAVFYVLAASAAGAFLITLAIPNDRKAN